MTDHAHQNCQSLLGSLSEYLDGELPAELCKEIEKHLEGCENCRVVLNTTRRTIEIVKVETNEEMPDEVRNRLFRRLNLDDLINRQTK